LPVRCCRRERDFAPDWRAHADSYPSRTPVDTVTNQAIGAFTELGLPYIKKWVADYRGQKQDRDAGKKTGYEMSSIARRDPQEQSFLQKVERELALVDYSNFTGESGPS
jgi:hypothetical protein